jgi:hypothetical protein
MTAGRLEAKKMRSAGIIWPSFTYPYYQEARHSDGGCGGGSGDDDGDDHDEVPGLQLATASGSESARSIQHLTHTALSDRL